MKSLIAILTAVFLYSYGGAANAYSICNICKVLKQEGSGGKAVAHQVGDVSDQITGSDGKKFVIRDSVDGPIIGRIKGFLWND